jgi:CBS domain-containing protein
VAARKTKRRARVVGQLMRREFISIAPDESLVEARQIMRLARLRHLPVVRDGALVGLLTYRDLLEFLFADAAPGPATDGLRVEAVMARLPHSVSPEKSLAYAASRLWQLHLGCLPVVEPDANGGRLVGLITEVDLLRAAYDPLYRVAT